MLTNPIAIIGASCLYPGCVTPEDLWKIVNSNQCSLSEKNGLYAGHIDFESNGIIKRYPQSSWPLAALDPLFLWLLHCSTSALDSAQIDIDAVSTLKTGIIAGNLSYPTASYNLLCEQFYSRGKWDIDYHNGFMSGLPAHVVADCLHLNGDAFCIDAACASSLYAMKLAIDRLNDHSHDLMLAGGINATDMKFLIKGFGALQALSQSKRCLPLHQQADGLIPAHGCGIVVLKRLSEAVRDKNTILAVIRSIGLANDGKSKGFLAPSSQGQLQALRQAYETASLLPSDIDLVECHATGTPVGDAIEIDTLKQFFSNRPIFISALKGNLGHSITASGCAAVIKTLQGFQHDQFAPSYIASPLSENIAGSGLSIVSDVTEKFNSDSPIRVGINGFGFGGCNAHAILERWVEQDFSSKIYFRKTLDCQIAVTGIGVIYGAHHNKASFYQHYCQSNLTGGKIDSIPLDYQEARMPPNDLHHTQGQQLLVLKATAEALHDLESGTPINNQRCSAFIGMQCETDVSRFSFSSNEETLTHADALGAMPNLVTNRLNAQYDLKGASFSVSAEQLSGLRAFQLAIQQLSQRETDTALVGAVDCHSDALHQSLYQHIKDSNNELPTDCAIVLVLERLQDATANQHRIYAVLDPNEDPVYDSSTDVTQSLHCSQRLMAITIKILRDYYGTRALTQTITPQYQCPSQHVQRPTIVSNALLPSILIEPFAGGQLALIAQSDQSFAALKQLAESKINTETSSLYDAENGIVFSQQPLKGKLASLFTAAHTSYYPMGHDLLTLFPGAVEFLHNKIPFTNSVMQALTQQPQQKTWPLLDELILYSSLSQAHHWVMTQFLKVNPDAMIGYCSGETNALFACEAWTDMANMIAEIEQSRLYTKYLAGDFSVTANGQWQSVRIFHEVAEVRSLVEPIEHCYLTIVNNNGDCVVSGDPKCLHRLLKQLPEHCSKMLSYSMVIHCPLVSQVQDLWHCLHLRNTYPVNMPLYSCAYGKSYLATRETAADALLQQAIHPVHFPTVIEQAWNDGVRIFVEHGPRDLCSQWVSKILADKPHCVLAFDAPNGDISHQVAMIAAALLVHQIPVEYPNLITSPTEASRSQAYPVHATMPQTSLFLDRQQLQVHACGKLSAIFGQSFSPLDNFSLRVRMPEPPLLLTDRVLSIDAEALSMKTGSIDTETDVSDDAWYLHANHMPAGVMIEAGQSDLLLISWLGIDFINNNQRVYRLLGCELTYLDGLPEIGDTLHYHIAVDGHARDGDISLFFFHYDCYINNHCRLKVRHGQAGFFSYAELANSKGVVWSADSSTPIQSATLDRPRCSLSQHQFDHNCILAFASGDMSLCFGESHRWMATHNCPPTIAQGNMRLFDAITDIDFNGGPWQRGFCRAVFDLNPDHWFFKGHFTDDPCMPGTLMFEGCLQVMSFYLTALGYTLDKDGWRFEPVSGMPFQLKCRGQATPQSKQLLYEIYIQEQIDDENPRIVADVLVIIDGLKAFHAHALALQLTRDYPISQKKTSLVECEQPIVTTKGITFDHQAMQHFSWGMPSKALGQFYAAFDTGRRVPRMPAPPYAFMHALTQLSATENNMEEGGEVTVAYRIPNDAWYFDQESNGNTMPFCILLEIALQPCGWLASYVGCPLHTDQVVCFRNLDGKANVLKVIKPQQGTVYTTAKLRSLSHFQDTFLLNFSVESKLNDEIVFACETSFGFFPREAFVNQQGLNPPSYLAEAAKHADNVNLGHPELSQSLPIVPSLLMLDCIEKIWREENIIFVQASKTIKASEWFFKAHFYQDPVQPGSLGLEAMLQLARFALVHHQQLSTDQARYLHIDPAVPIEWSYRGQVTPANQRSEITIRLEPLSNESSAAKVSGWLSVDGVTIYQALFTLVA